MTVVGPPKTTTSSFGPTVTTSSRQAGRRLNAAPSRCWLRSSSHRRGCTTDDEVRRRPRRTSLPENGHAYFSKIARRLQLIDRTTLARQLDDAERAGRLSAEDDASVHLLVEASLTIAGNDVERARQRAHMLAGIVGTEVVPVVAGEVAPEATVAAAQEAGVWCVTDGRAISPDDGALAS